MNTLHTRDFLRNENPKHSMIITSSEVIAVFHLFHHVPFRWHPTYTSNSTRFSSVVLTMSESRLCHELHWALFFLSQWFSSSKYWIHKQRFSRDCWSTRSLPLALQIKVISFCARSISTISFWRKGSWLFMYVFYFSIEFLQFSVFFLKRSGLYS